MRHATPMTLIRGAARPLLTAGALLLAAATVQAAPVSGMGTWETTLHARDLDGDGNTDAFYDSVLDISWLARQNPDYARYCDHAAYLAASSFFGIDGWRLPMAASLAYPCPVGICGYNVQTSDNELAHLFHVTLGNLSNPTGGALVNSGDFPDLNPTGEYWQDGSDALAEMSFAGRFVVRAGIQVVGNMTSGASALYVHDGDVGARVAEVPEPSTALLAAGALGAWWCVRRRRQSAI